MFDIAVIGLGMIGSAALRALSESPPALRVVGLGPDEPTDWLTHGGAFASHYDHARITRVSDPDEIWAALARRSMDSYAAIERRSGVSFHHPAGHLRIGQHTRDTSLADAERFGRLLGAPVERLDRARLGERFPYLALPGHAAGLFEGGGAGWINPRALVAAQLTIAAAQGAQIVRDEVSQLQRDGAGFTIQTRGGAQVQSARVLVSAHGYSGPLLRPYLGRGIDMMNLAHTTAYAEISEGQAHALAGMPSLIWPLDGHPLLPSAYATPPVRYPDGRYYLKVGAPMHEPHVLRLFDEAQGWFQSGGNPLEITALQGVLADLIPSLAVLGWSAKPCMNSYTAHNRPYITQLDDGLFLCAGGCGAAAKSSDAIGRLGAALARDGEWTDDLPQEAFRIAFS
jgi:sarcosine oxidase